MRPFKGTTREAAFGSALSDERLFHLQPTAVLKLASQAIPATPFFCPAQDYQTTVGFHLCASARPLPPRYPMAWVRCLTSQQRYVTPFPNLQELQDANGCILLEEGKPMPVLQQPSTGTATMTHGKSNQESFGAAGIFTSGTGGPPLRFALYPLHRSIAMLSTCLKLIFVLILFESNAISCYAGCQRDSISTLGLVVESLCTPIMPILYSTANYT
jgi:hypothetical protein